MLEMAFFCKFILQQILAIYMKSYMYICMYIISRISRSIVEYGYEARSSLRWMGRWYCTVVGVCLLGCSHCWYSSIDGRIVCFLTHTSIALVRLISNILKSTPYVCSQD